MTDDERIAAATDRYMAAAHGMQTGVAFTMDLDPDESSPKHLRVGVNSAMVEHAALVKLLLDAGVITMADYREALADAMERERDTYAEQLGPNITLR